MWRCFHPAKSDALSPEAVGGARVDEHVPAVAAVGEPCSDGGAVAGFGVDPVFPREAAHVRAGGEVSVAEPGEFFGEHRGGVFGVEPDDAHGVDVDGDGERFETEPGLAGFFVSGDVVQFVVVQQAEQRRGGGFGQRVVFAERYAVVGDCEREPVGVERERGGLVVGVVVGLHDPQRPAWFRFAWRFGGGWLPGGVRARAAAGFGMDSADVCDAQRLTRPAAVEMGEVWSDGPCECARLVECFDDLGVSGVERCASGGLGGLLAAGGEFESGLEAAVAAAVGDDVAELVVVELCDFGAEGLGSAPDGGVVVLVVAVGERVGWGGHAVGRLATQASMSSARQPMACALICSGRGKSACLRRRISVLRLTPSRSQTWTGRRIAGVVMGDSLLGRVPAARPACPRGG